MRLLNKRHYIYSHVCSLLKGKESKTKIYCEKLQSKIAANHCVNISKGGRYFKKRILFWRYM